MTLIAAPPVARAFNPGFTGETGQGQKMTVDIDGSGRITAVGFEWKGRCKSTPRVLPARFEWSSPRSGTSFSGRRTYEVQTTSGFWRVTASMTARRLSRDRWEGTLSATAVVGRPKIWDRCQLDRTTWVTTIPQKVSLRFSGDKDDFVTAGKSGEWTWPGDTVFASTATRDRLEVTADLYGDAWSLSVAAPIGQTFRTGRTYAAEGVPTVSRAGVAFSGDSRGCNKAIGTLRVRSASYDREGRLQALDASFVQNCEALGPTARGRVVFRR